MFIRFLHILRFRILGKSDKNSFKIMDRLVDMLLLKLAATDGLDLETGESSYLHQVVHNLGMKNGYVVDIAASDGFTQSPTLGFYKMGWSGLAVEMDTEKFSKLSFLYSDFDKVSLARAKITPSNILEMLKAFSCPKEFSILNLDIDSYDLFVAEALLTNGFRPQIISMEINEKIPTGVNFSVLYDENHFWKGDHFYGCSLDAAASLVKPFNYSLIGLEYNNAFFVVTDLASGNYKDLTTKEAYESGYVYRKDRKLKFPHNIDVESWLELDTQPLVNIMNEYFKGYEGKYLLKESDLG
jgi:hypothetical protein